MKIDSSIGLIVFIGVFTLAPLIGFLTYKLSHDLKRINSSIFRVCLSITITGTLSLIIGFKTISYEFNQVYFGLFYLTTWILFIQLLYQARFVNRNFAKLIAIFSIVIFGITGVTFFIPSLLFMNSTPQKYYIQEDNKRIEVFPQGAPLHPAGAIMKSYNEFGPFLFLIENTYFENYDEFESSLKKKKQQLTKPKKTWGETY